MVQKGFNVFTLIPLNPAISFFSSKQLASGKKNFFLLYLRFYVPVNSYSHVERVSTPNHTFSEASLTMWLTSAHTFTCNLQPFLNQRKEENDHRNFFMIYLQVSMRLDLDLQSDLLPTRSGKSERSGYMQPLNLLLRIYLVRNQK